MQKAWVWNSIRVGLICLLSVNAAASEEFGSSSFPPRTDAQREGMEILKRFNETQEFLPGSSISDEQRQLFSQTCYALTQDCIEYIRKNRLIVKQSLPNNPLYWQNYWKAIEASVMNHQRTNLLRPTNDLRFDMQKLVDATQAWPMQELAEHSRIDLRVFVDWTRHIRQLRAESDTLLGNMIGIAMVSIATDAINYMFWQARNEARSTDLPQLQRLLALQTVAEKSMRPSLEGEFAHTSTYLGELVLSGRDDELEGGISAQAYLSEMRVVLSALVDVSERPWGAYWSQGVDVLEQGLVQHPLFTMDNELTNLMNYNSYVMISGEVDVARYLLLALSDVYAARVSPGTVARPDPPHWQYQWRSNPEQVCLLPISVHPSWKIDTLGDRCVTYLGE